MTLHVRRHIVFRRPWVFLKPDFVAQIVFTQSCSLICVLLQSRPPKQKVSLLLFMTWLFCSSWVCTGCSIRRSEILPGAWRGFCPLPSKTDASGFWNILLRAWCDYKHLLEGPRSAEVHCGIHKEAVRTSRVNIQYVSKTQTLILTSACGKRCDPQLNQRRCQHACLVEEVRYTLL